MKNKNSFATGRCPDAVQRADSAGRLQGETIVSRQALKNTSARTERFTGGEAIPECIKFSTVSAPASTSFCLMAHSRRSNPMDNSDLSAFSKGKHKLEVPIETQMHKL